MQVAKTTNDKYRVVVTDREAQILVNAMRASLAEIMPREFRTRTGSLPEEIDAIASALEKALN